MKKSKSILVAALMLFSIGIFAQKETKVIAVVTKAEWCPTCKANGGRVMTEVLSQYKEPQVKIVVNDVTDDKTKMDCKESIHTAGLENILSKDNATGVITLINAKTKKVIAKISVAKSNEEIKKAFDDAIAKS